jgi:RHS repeat-associated protein
VTGAANSNSYQYTGRENDGTGLNYYRARYYDPTLQRFISEDPIGFAAGDLNLYGYTNNSPTNFRDPTGNFVSAPVVAGVLCATGAIAGAYAYNQLSGRKTTIGGYAASAAAGCLGGVGLGWGIGVAVEAMFPGLMLAGGEAQLWAGVSANLARAEAAAYGRALVNSTFSGSAIGIAQTLGLMSGNTAYGMMQSLSSNFLSGASSASVLLGPEANATKTFFTHELPTLVQNGANIAIQYLRP